MHVPQVGNRWARGKAKKNVLANTLHKFREVRISNTANFTNHRSTDHSLQIVATAPAAAYSHSDMIFIHGKTYNNNRRLLWQGNVTFSNEA